MAPGPQPPATHGFHSEAQDLLEVGGEVGEEDVDAEVTATVGHRDGPNRSALEDGQPRSLGSLQREAQITA